MSFFNKYYAIPKEVEVVGIRIIKENGKFYFDFLDIDNSKQEIKSYWNDLKLKEKDEFIRWLIRHNIYQNYELELWKLFKEYLEEKKILEKEILKRINRLKRELK